MCAIVLIITGLPLINTDEWWIRIFDFPRLQIAVLILLALVLAAIFVDFNWRIKVPLLILLSAALVYQVQFIVIYTPLYPTQAKDSNMQTKEDSFTILVSNVRMDNEDKEPFHAMVQSYNPDVLLINEPNQEWAASISRLEEDFAHSIKHPLENTYGMILLSKLPLSESAVNFLVNDSIPSIYTRITLPSGIVVDFYGVHPEPPKPGTDTYERDTELLIVGRKIRASDNPAIVAGDLNDVGWSDTSKRFRRYSGLVDPREGRGLFNTFSVSVPIFRYPLDHIFYSREFGLLTIKKLDDIGSDHFPLLIGLNYEPDSKNAEGLETTNTKEEAEVEETIEKGLKESTSKW